MPVKSSSSPVLKWPDGQAVTSALATWAASIVETRDDVLLLGYIGSYARGDSGVGSDLDIVIVVAQCDGPPARRSAAWDTTSLPVPADVLVYTRDEWLALPGDSRFYRTIQAEAVWVHVSAAAADLIQASPE